MRIMLFLNNKCNMHCPYCYDVRDRDGTEMTEETILQVIEFAKRQNDKKMVITFAGGEPSLSPQLIRFAMDRCPPDFMFQIMTNGYHYSKDFWQTLKLYKHRIGISLSFDGIYQELRETGSTDKVLENLATLKRMGIFVGIGFTLHKDAVTDLYENFKYIAQFHNVIKIKRECLAGTKWDDTFFHELTDSIDKLVDCCSFMETVYGYQIDMPYHIQLADINQHPAREGNIFCTDYVYYDTVVATDGTIYPCEYYCAEGWGAVGHVKDGSCNKEKYKNIKFKQELEPEQYVCVFLNEKMNGDLTDCTGCVCADADKLFEEKRIKYQRRLEQLRRLQQDANTRNN